MKTVSYKPLWKTLIDKNIKNKTDLLQIAGVGRGTLAKLSKNQEVSMTVLLKICNALNCELPDVAEITENS
jgi:DNA-binding Xre family transcriptional regulator